MNIFMGYRGFIKCKKHGQLKLFWKYLKYQWLHDLKSISFFILLSPWLIITILVKIANHYCEIVDDKLPKIDLSHEKKMMRDIESDIYSNISNKLKENNHENV